MTGGEVQIRFTSTDYPIINSESISIPLNATPEQLKSLVEGLIQSKLGQGSESSIRLAHASRTGQTPLTLGYFPGTLF